MGSLVEMFERQYDKLFHAGQPTFMANLFSWLPLRYSQREIDTRHDAVRRFARRAGASRLSIGALTFHRRSFD